jgi:hypothetical protein
MWRILSITSRSVPGAVAIHRERIGAELQQQGHDRRPAHSHREMERQLVVLVATHPSVESGGILRHDPADFVRKVHRDRGEDVVPRAATDEKLRDRTMRGVVAPLPACCPTDHLELVVVTLAHDVTARIHEPPHDVQMTARCSPMHRVGVVSVLTRIDIQAASQQQIHRRKVTCREVQQRRLIRFRADVQLRRMLVEQGGQRVNLAVPRGIEQLALHRQRVDVRLERPPAREAVLLRDVELRGGQSGARVRRSQLLEPALGLLAKPVQVRSLRE